LNNINPDLKEQW